MHANYQQQCLPLELDHL